MTDRDISCRLCGAQTTVRFSTLVLQKYKVHFYQCEGCKSLESEIPYWLEEAYAGRRAIPDVAATSRLQRLVPLVLTVARVFGVRYENPVLDFGGGDGFLVRRLRDLGLNAWILDKYATNRYAVGFEGSETQQYRMITAFEVWEHFSQPAVELARLFAMNPDVLLISTGVYESQDASWPYLTPLSGRHVFFYSMHARDLIARRYGYCLISKGSFCVFHRTPLSWHRRAAARAALSVNGQRALRAVYPFMPTSPRLEADRKYAKQLIESGHAGEINWP
jgi:hypothetical protein